MPQSSDQALIAANARIMDLERSLGLAYRQVDNMAGVLRQLIEAHENADSGADIPVHIYKLAKAACPPAQQR